MSELFNAVGAECMGGNLDAAARPVRDFAAILHERRDDLPAPRSLLTA